MIGLERHPRRFAARFELAGERAERRRFRLRQRGPVRTRRFEEDVEVTHRAERGCDVTERLLQSPSGVGWKGGTEDAPCRTEPTRRDAHLVELLGVAALTRARLAREQSLEVEGHDLSARLGERVGRLRVTEVRASYGRVTLSSGDVRESDRVVAQTRARATPARQ